MFNVDIGKTWKRVPREAKRNDARLPLHVRKVSTRPLTTFVARRSLISIQFARETDEGNGGRRRRREAVVTITKWRHQHQPARNARDNALARESTLRRDPKTDSGSDTTRNDGVECRRQAATIVAIRSELSSENRGGRKLVDSDLLGGFGRILEERRAALYILLV